jgi:hypothetical protein|tara:strand:+ start:39761 stop:40030 length:270 start_codon:yes stop_codon:yes gene_type:complete
MIAFRKDWDSNEDDQIEEMINKLKDILGEVNNDFQLHEDINQDFYASINISEIINLIYNAMYQKDNEIISLLINKNPNNSLDVSIDYIK